MAILSIITNISEISNSRGIDLIITEQMWEAGHDFPILMVNAKEEEHFVQIFPLVEVR